MWLVLYLHYTPCRITSTKVINIKVIYFAIKVKKLSKYITVKMVKNRNLIEEANYYLDFK